MTDRRRKQTPAQQAHAIACDLLYARVVDIGMESVVDVGTTPDDRVEQVRVALDRIIRYHAARSGR